MLESITIKNFRSCDITPIRLNEPVVALVGKNGVGKTNLLHAIQLAANLCVGEPESAFSIHTRDQTKPTAFELEFSFSATQYRYETRRTGISARSEEFHESLTRNGEDLYRRTGSEIRLPIAEFPGLRIGPQTSSLSALLQLLPPDHPLALQLRPVADYVRAIRYQPLIQGFQEHTVGSPSVRGDWAGDVSPFIETARYEAWKVELSQGRARPSVQLRVLHLSLTDSDSFNELKTLLGEDGLGLISDIRVESVKLPRRSDRGEDSIEAYAITFMPGSGLAGAGRWFRYSGLSAGTWRVLQLLTYLLFDKYSCMLVEQPEDSIHAGLLEKVVDVLRTYAGRTQLICTTHSPRVMNLVGATGIRMVTADEGQTNVSELSDSNLDAAKLYLEDRGTLAEFLETL